MAGQVEHCEKHNLNYRGECPRCADDANPLRPSPADLERAAAAARRTQEESRKPGAVSHHARRKAKRTAAVPATPLAAKLRAVGALEFVDELPSTVRKLRCETPYLGQMRQHAGKWAPLPIVEKTTARSLTLRNPGFEFAKRAGRLWGRYVGATPEPTR